MDATDRGRLLCGGGKGGGKGDKGDGCGRVCGYSTAQASVDMSMHDT